MPDADPPVAGVPARENKATVAKAAWQALPGKTGWRPT